MPESGALEWREDGRSRTGRGSADRPPALYAGYFGAWFGGLKGQA
jgi:hypothetical protein